MSKRNNNFARRPNGFYATTREAFHPLIPHLRRAVVIEPCAGDGALTRMLREERVEVVAQFDIAPQHPEIVRKDARDITRADFGDAYLWITNPPWPLPAKDNDGIVGEPTLGIIENLLQYRPGWALMPADFMHNVYAAALMKRCRCIISIGRVKWFEGSEHRSKDNCCWYYFEPGEARSMVFIPNAGKPVSERAPKPADPLVAAYAKALP